MTIRERILATLYWKEPDQIPLTIYGHLIPQGEPERRLREMGLGLTGGARVFSSQHQNIEIVQREYREQGQKRIRQTIKTPIGDVSQESIPDTSPYSGGDIKQEYYVKGPDDYKVMEYILNDPVYRPTYESVHERIRIVGEDGLVYIGLPKQTLQTMLYELLGFEQFTIDYFERRDLFDSLYSTLAKRHEEVYEIAAGAPVEILRLGANVSAEVVGDERYRAYLMPQYARLRQMLRGTDKKVYVHMDGLLAPLADAIAEAEFDIVEALTPPPMGDISVARAREVWPNKGLWINFPGPTLLESPDVVEDLAREIVRQAGHKRGFIIAVTEDAPLEPMEKSLEVIARVLSEG